MARVVKICIVLILFLEKKLQTDKIESKSVILENEVLLIDLKISVL